MPALTPAQRQSLRQHPQRGGQNFLYIFVPPTVLVATSDIAGRPQVVPYNLVSGNFADVTRGMTLRIEDSSGNFKGIARIRADADAVNLYVSEGETLLAVGDRLVALGEYRLWATSPYIDPATGTIYKDWDGGAEIAFPGPGPAGAGIQRIFQPCPVMGPHSVRWLGESHAFDWSRSWGISPLTGTLSFTDAFPGAAVVHDTPSTGTATWGTAGARWCSLTVSDDLSGLADLDSYPGRRLFVTLDPSWTDEQARANGLYVDFQPGPRIGSVAGGGFSMQFTVQVDAPESSFPDNALVLWFFSGGTQDEISGNWPDRSHIKFIGHIRKASTHKEPETGYVTFSATTIQAQMKNLPMFTNFLEIDATPTIWTQAHDLTVQRAAYLHMRWMTSLLEVADVLFVPEADTSIGEHVFPEADLYTQLNALVNRDYMYRIGCDPLSTVYFNKDPQFTTTEPDTIMTIEAQDWREELDFPEPLTPQTSYVIASGNAYAAGVLTPLFSEAPGPVPLERGKKDKSLSRLICTTQAALNTVSGLALAAANNDFPDIPVKLDGQYYIGHLFPMELVGLDVQGLLLPRGTKRGMDLTGDLFVPRRSQLQVVYDPDGAVSNALVDVNVEKLTTGEGVDGQDLTYPVSVDDLTVPGPDEGPDGGDWQPPAPVDPGGVPGDGNLLYFIDHVSGHLYRTRNARHSNPASVIYEDLGQVGTGEIHYITLDSWNPKNSAMICGDDGIWRSTNLDAAIPTWNLVASGLPYGPTLQYNDNFHQAASSILQRHRWMAVSRFWNGDQAAWFCRVWFSDTGDLGDWGIVGLDIWGFQCGARPTIEASSHDVDKAWVVWIRDNDDFVTETDDFWATYASAQIPGVHNSGSPSGYHRHKDNPTDEFALYAAKQGVAPASAQSVFCVNDPAACTWAALDIVGSDSWWCGGYTWGTNKYWVLTQLDTGGYKFFISDDALVWTDQFPFAGVTRFISGWPYNGERFYACQDGAVAPILISDDRGATWTAQTGNWAAVGPGAGAQIYCCVPVWIE